MNHDVIWHTSTSLQVLERIPQAKSILSNKDLKGSIGSAHVTLAHKASHGVAAVAAYAPLRGTEIQLQLTALLFSEKLAALEVELAPSSVPSKNEWPHLTVSTMQL